VSRGSGIADEVPERRERGGKNFGPCRQRLAAICLCRESGPTAAFRPFMPRSRRSRSPAKRKPAGGAPEPRQGVSGETLPVLRQAAAPRSGEGLLLKNTP